METFFLGKKNRQKKRLFSFPNTLWSNNEPAATDPCDIGAQKAPSRIERGGRREHQLLSSCDDPKVEEERVALGRGGVRASRSSFDASTRMPCASPTRIRRQLSLVLLVVDSRLRVADFTARRRERFGETEKHVQVFRRRKRKWCKRGREKVERRRTYRNIFGACFPVLFSRSLARRAQKRRENTRRRTKRRRRREFRERVWVRVHGARKKRVSR